jgi:hypothetical protein
MNKKGFGAGMGGGRKAFSIILGLIFLALGVIPLLNYFGVMSFSLPTVPLIILSILALAGAIVLIWDGFKEESQGIGSTNKAIGIISIIVALILIVWGLNYFGILPFSIPSVAQIIIDIIFTLAGLLLIIGAFAVSF